MQKSKWQIFRGHRLVYCFFFLSVLEFGQHSWLTEDLIRGHTGHETGSCHPPMGTSLGLYSLGLPGNKGSKHDNEERLVLLFAGFLSFPPFFGQRIPTRERSFLLFQCLYFFSPTICCQWFLTEYYCLMFFQIVSSLEHSIKAVCCLQFLSRLGRQMVLVLLQQKMEKWLIPDCKVCWHYC